MSHRSDVAQFYCSTEEDLRFRLTFENLTLAGRTLRINIRERDTNTIKKTLNHGDLIISSSGVAGHPVDNDVYAAVLLADMAGWKLGEYEADLLDITGGATRIVAARITYDTPGELVYGVVGNQATVRIVDNQAIITATGGLGVAGPANSLTVPVDGVETVEPDQPAQVIIEGDPPSQTIRFKIPRGVDGHAGWSPVFAINADGERSVLRLAGWIGGGGDPPPHLSGSDPIYVGAGGFTTNIALAADLRGDKGDIGDQGDKGWTPLLAMVEDGARRVLQIQSWTGGEGSAPAPGGYLGPSGIVATAAEATDFRGEPGASVGPGSIGTDELADDAVTEEKIDSAYRATLATQDDLGGYTPRTDVTGSSVIPSGTTAQRDATPSAGFIRFNTTTGEYEGGDGSDWVPIGGGGALVADTPPTANLREGLLWFSRSWGALFVYYVDANGGHWVSTTPVIDPSAFVLLSTAQVDLGFSAFMWAARTATSAAAARAALGAQSYPFKNYLINARGTINQRGYVSGAAVGLANTYTVDRWRVVTNGQSLSWTESAGIRTFTAPAGGVEQVIEALNLFPGTYTLSWVGTATATINGDAIANGGQVVVAGGSNVSVKFSSGTFSLPQFEMSPMATEFGYMPEDAEFQRCLRYYEVFTTTETLVSMDVVTGQGYTMGFRYQVEKRINPAVILGNNMAGFNAPSLNSAGLKGMRITATSNVTAAARVFSFSATINAEI